MDAHCVRYACSMEIETKTADECIGGAVVVVAKCPIAGVSKTRLAPLLGDEGAAQLAQAMLSDVLVSLSECPLLRSTLKVLLYAPDTKSGELQMESILRLLNLPYANSTKAQQLGRSLSEWVLLPMKSSVQNETESNSDLTSSSLGDKLTDALDRTRELMRMTKSSTIQNTNNYNEVVLFLGMDSPELPMEEVVYGLQISSGNKWLRNDMPDHKSKRDCIDNTLTATFGRAHVCPAVDGGYGLISIPGHAPSSKVFSGVRWSQPLTAVSQLKALTDSNVDVSIGKLMHDVDEPSDVHELVKRLHHYCNYHTQTIKSDGQTFDVLTSSSTGSRATVSIAEPQSFPRHTWKALADMNLIQKDNAT
ncbi:hypothetical protein ACHAXH_005952 [Discostella pseudostelligera]